MTCFPFQSLQWLRRYKNNSQKTEYPFVPSSVTGMENLRQVLAALHNTNVATKTLYFLRLELNTEN